MAPSSRVPPLCNPNTPTAGPGVQCLPLGSFLAQKPFSAAPAQGGRDPCQSFARPGCDCLRGFFLSLGSVIRVLLITSLLSLLISQERVVATVSPCWFLLGQRRRRKGANLGIFQLNSSKSAPRTAVAGAPPYRSRRRTRLRSPADLDGIPQLCKPHSRGALKVTS